MFEGTGHGEELSVKSNALFCTLMKRKHHHVPCFYFKCTTVRVNELLKYLHYKQSCDSLQQKAISAKQQRHSSYNSSTNNKPILDFILICLSFTTDILFNEYILFFSLILVSFFSDLYWDIWRLTNSRALAIWQVKRSLAT